MLKPLGLHMSILSLNQVFAIKWIGKLASQSLTHSLVICKMGYCNVIYIVVPLKSMQELLQVQNALA